PKFRRLLQRFALDLTASDTAKPTGADISSVNSLYLKLHRRLAEECERQASLYGIAGLDEPYFGAKRIRG
ncbi:IS1595 family transposase, partial [Neisseria sp. P0008.S010]